MVAGGNVLRCVPGEPTLRYGIASDLVHHIALHLPARVGSCNRGGRVEPVALVVEPVALVVEPVALVHLV